MIIAPRRNQKPSKRGGKRPGAGRPRGTGHPEHRKVKATIYLDPRAVAYLERWKPTEDGNLSDALEEMVARCEMMWPNGPASNPVTARRSGRAQPRPERG